MVRHKQPSSKRPRKPAAPQQPNALCFTLRGFQANGGPSRTSTYNLAKRGILKIFKDELGRTLVDGDSARDFLRNKTA
jgi:hypothetical protein